MMPFHHDSGERGAMAVALSGSACEVWMWFENWFAASVCDKSISAENGGGLSDEYAHTGGACTLGTWPQRERARASTVPTYSS